MCYIFNLRQVCWSNIVNSPLDELLPRLAPRLSLTGKSAVITGMEFSEKTPFSLRFYFSKHGENKILEKDITRMVKYFLGFLSVPQEDLWVNLSPFESDRIIPQSLAKLDIGKDFLLEDYCLKQLSGALTDPKTPSGKKFWKEAGVAGNNISNFKVWIVPDKAQVCEYKNNGEITAVIQRARLKVLMQENYNAPSFNTVPAGSSLQWGGKEKRVPSPGLGGVGKGNEST